MPRSRHTPSPRAIPADAVRRLRLVTAARPTAAASRPAATTILRGVGAGLAMAATLQLLGGFPGAAGIPATDGGWAAAGTLALSLVATCLLVPWRRVMRGPTPGLLLAVAVGLPLLGAAWLLLWHDVMDPFVPIGWRCFGASVAMAPWPFLALSFAGRPFDPRHPALAGAALGATAGAWSAVLLELGCPLTIPDHVFVCHVLPLVLLAGGGALYGARRFGLRQVTGGAGGA